jgi:uncharacterized LabA/DUF88 family protein
VLKAGIFLDMNNLMRNGGWGLRYDVVKELVAAQGTTVLRANAYMAVDTEREALDLEYRQRIEAYHAAIRRNGYHLVLKEVKRYRDAEGEVVMKANADLDLAVEAMLQSENLDYLLLGTGDGDFLRLVRAVQNHGKRVDLLSFDNTSTELRREVDNHFNGFLIPGLLPAREGAERRMRGYMHYVEEKRGYGFLTVRTGLAPDAVRDDVFCHIRDFSRDGVAVDNMAFAALKSRSTILEFDLGQDDAGRPKASAAVEFRWSRTDGRTRDGD